MKYLNFLMNEIEQIGVIHKNKIIPINNFLDTPLTLQELIEQYEQMDLVTKVHSYTGVTYDLNQVKYLAPIPEPKRNLFCLGKNYFAHALEMKGKTGDLVDIPSHPIYFSKTCLPVIGHEEEITGHLGVSEQVDYEVELVVIIGKKGKNIPAEEAKSYIFGYTIANDISARDLQMKHVQWHKGKSLDGFCPMGPFVIECDDVPYPPDLAIKCYVGDELRQDGRTSDLIFDLDTIISDLSSGMTLYPGDMILTGTPAGVGMGFNPPKYLKSGDEMTCEIEAIGQLKNRLK